MNNCSMEGEVVAVKSIHALSSKLLAVRSGSSVVVLSVFYCLYIGFEAGFTVTFCMWYVQIIMSSRV